MEHQEFQINRKLVLTDIMMERFRSIFRTAKISWSDKKFAESCKWGWYIPNYSMVGTTTREGGPLRRGLRKPLKPRKYIVGLYSPRNFLKEFLKCESLICPTADMLIALESALGYRDELYFLNKSRYNLFEKEEIDNPKFKEKHKYDVCAHLRPHVNVDEFLEACGYLTLRKDGSYVPTGKFFSSPRVVMRQKILKKEAEKLAKAREAQARMKSNNKGDESKNRLANLKRFFDINKWKNEKEGELKI